MNEALKKKIKKMVKVLVFLIGIIFVVLFIIIMFLPNQPPRRNYVAAFKAETSGVVPGILIDCDENKEPAVPVDTETIDWADSFSSTDCGLQGKSTFTILANYKKKNCTATVTDSGATFSGPDC